MTSLPSSAPGFAVVRSATDAPGTASRMAPDPANAAATGATVAEVSPATLRSSGCLEPKTTSWPAVARTRPRIPPMKPVPITVIRISASSVLVRCGSCRPTVSADPLGDRGADELDRVAPPPRPRHRRQPPVGARHRPTAHAPTPAATALEHPTRGSVGQAVEDGARWPSNPGGWHRRRSWPARWTASRIPPEALTPIGRPPGPGRDRRPVGPGWPPPRGWRRRRDGTRWRSSASRRRPPAPPRRSPPAAPGPGRPSRG